MWRVDSLIWCWCWEGLSVGGEGDDRGWDGWMASPTPWTWVWVNSGSWWWTGRPGVLQFMGSQRVRHDWVTELNWTELKLQITKVRAYECDKPLIFPLDSDPEWKGRLEDASTTDIFKWQKAGQLSFPRYVSSPRSSADSTFLVLTGLLDRSINSGVTPYKSKVDSVARHGQSQAWPRPTNSRQKDQHAPWHPLSHHFLSVWLPN